MTEPQPIPDTKDWTWVLERPCAACGFTATEVAPGDVSGLLRANIVDWQTILAGPVDEVRRRPSPDTWSALEYGCHVRDVHRLYLYRLELMLAEDGPDFPDWNQDETAITDDYPSSDPVTVAAELAEAGHLLADRFDTVTTEQWARTGYRSDGAAFTIDSFARYFVHDPIHHVADVRNASG